MLVDGFVMQWVTTVHLELYRHSETSFIDTSYTPECSSNVSCKLASTLQLVPVSMTRWQYKITKSLELDVQLQFNIYFVRNIYDLFPYITQNAQRVDYQNQDIFIQVYLCPGYTPHVTHSLSSSLPSTQSRGTLSVKWSPSGVDHFLLCATTMAHT